MHLLSKQTCSQDRQNVNRWTHPKENDSPSLRFSLQNIMKVPVGTESASSDGHIEWEATPPPELSDSAARASKRGYPTSLSPDTIEDDIDNTESARKRVRFPGAVGIGEKSLVTNGYKGDLADKIPGKQSSCLLPSKNLGSVTPEMLKRSHVPDSSMRSSGDSYGEAATEGSAGLIATSVSNDDRDGHNHGSGNRDGSHPMKPRRSLRSARATTIPAAPPSQAVLEEYNILHVEYQTPDVDETFNTELQDPLLAASYPGLPNLYAKAGPGNMLLSSWPQIIPDLPEALVYSSLIFVFYVLNLLHGHYINPARINHMLLQAVMPIYFREKFRRCLWLAGNSSSDRRGCNHFFYQVVQTPWSPQFFMILLLLIQLAEKTAAKNLRIAGVASPAAKPGTPRQSSSSAGFQTVLGYDDTISLTIAHPDRYIDLIHKYPLIIILDDSNYNYLWGSLIE
ncbi:hypothetical protein C8J57DRAFT_1480073 [Mycena rebaudengoi]|nr:hypothetical protein C8J57DRAFT_1480073 [Mycena rebaudengoi]